MNCYMNPNLPRFNHDGKTIAKYNNRKYLICFPLLRYREAFLKIRMFLFT